MRIDQPILVITDHVGSLEAGYTLTAPSKQLLTLARSLTSGRIDAIALNPAPDQEALAEYGADRVLVPDLQGLSPRTPAVVADCAQAAAKSNPDYAAIVNVSNYRGKEVAGTLGVRLGSGAAVDVTDCHVNDGRIEAVKSVLAGSWTTTFQVRKGTPVVALRPSSIEAEPAPEPAAAKIEALEVEFCAPARAVEIISSQPQPDSGRMPLPEAPIVVCAGRGVEGDLTLVEKLADKLGAAVGATRVVCDEGWMERSAQIGQTGVSIAPRLYIGVGVSGAVHHACGIQASEHIVAICDDPDAPIMELADLAIVGDLEEVIPAALEILDEN
ncbi:MAG: electron transfer flavoprotein subunit alpha/FixB family protein [Actinomycetaceae bacterium]|nr:electron transfer flavoprotein subunit alpha/FixB family protein [Actinomycetaceae bacterium]